MLRPLKSRNGRRGPLCFGIIYVGFHRKVAEEALGVPKAFFAFEHEYYYGAYRFDLAFHFEFQSGYQYG